MTLEEVITQTLTSIESLGDRVYPVGALKNAKPDFVFYLRRAQDEEDALDGPTGLKDAAFEIHCVAATYVRLVALSGDVQAALRHLQGTEWDGLLIERVACRQASPDLLEQEVSLYRRAFALQIDYQEVSTNE